MSVTLFFDLDKTLCHPTAPFLQIFFASCAPLLESSSAERAAALVEAWEAALEEPGPSTTAGCLARAVAATGLVASQRQVEQCAHALVTAWAETQQLAPGVMATLARLAQEHPLGLITNGPGDSQHAVMTALSLDEIFRWRIVSGDAEIGIRKPHAGIFQRALAMSESAPRDTWYIGDSPVNDIAGAAAAGWRTCWIAPPDRAFVAGLPEPDAHIARLDELPRIIRESL